MDIIPNRSPQSRPPAVLPVGAVQVESENGQIKANLARALPLVEDGASQGARLILLPEFLPTGYVYTSTIWDAAEPREGPTVEWLKQHARRLSIYLGTSYLEADGEDFYNTFVLATPEGGEAGRVRKETPIAFEAFFTVGNPGPHVIETEIGKIGVSICYENQLAYASRLMFAHSVDLMLMPHSAPVPAASILVSNKHINQYISRLRDLASVYDSQLGIPVLKVNKVHKGISHLVITSDIPKHKGMSKKVQMYREQELAARIMRDICQALNQSCELVEQ